MKNLFRFLIPRKTSTYGSNLRKYWSLASIVVVLAFSFEAFVVVLGKEDILISNLIAVIVVIWSVLFFSLVVVTIPFLASERFKPDPIRLFVDGIISICLSILSFALAYRMLGIVGPENILATESTDFIYFSSVTFSTLGFGDFRPDTSARLLAACQAIIGNLHLGVIVGAAFFAAQASDQKK
jgi:hypothetical protein